MSLLKISDFCKYSCISEINFPKKKNIKILVKPSRFVGSINFENRLISCISEHCFFKLLEWSQLDFKMQYLVSVTSVCLCIDDKTSYVPIMLGSYYPEVDIDEAGHVRSTAILKNGKTTRKAPSRKSSVHRHSLFHNWEWNILKISVNFEN